jgi:hypothetical protein
MGGMKTVVPQFIIKKYRDSINALPEQAKSVKGWFEPVYLRDKPTPKGSIIPYYFNEVTFKKAPPSMYDAPVEMFRPPKRGYTGRYFSGTDPVPSDTGTSKHSTSILDAAAVVREVNGRKLFIPTMACLVNHRTNNAKQTFLQSVLARMAYRNLGQRACTEVVEIEQGWNYLGFQELDYIDTYETVRYRTEMPGKFTGGAHPKGVSMKKQRKSDAHLYLIEMIEEIGPFIKLLPFWNQLMNIKTTEQNDGTVQWKTKDVRRMNDDVVFSTMYAYMDWKISGDTPFHHGVDEVMTELVPVVVGEPGNLRWEMQEQKLYGEE